MGEGAIWTNSGQAFSGRAKKEDGGSRARIRMTGASFAQIACPTFSRDERYSGLEAFLGGNDRLRKRLLKSLTGFD